MRATLRDIAKITGVHFTTVGLALRRDPRLSPATIAKVKAAAEKLGYAHDPMLSALSSYRHHKSRKFAGVLAFLITYDLKTLKSRDTERITFDAASARAQSQNFALEAFQIDSPGMTPARMSRMLRARGIQGLILSPRLPGPGPIPDLDWKHFSTVALGFSITNLNVHRVCTYHAHNMQLCLAQLRARGYRRTGLILPRDIYLRSRGAVLGAYAGEQAMLPPDEQVTPLVAHAAEITKASVATWVREQRVDSIILSSMPLEILEFLRQLGHRVPEDLGIALISRFLNNVEIAGIDEQMTLLGQGAVDAVIAMMGRHEKGLPAYPRYTLIEGSWADGPTVRALPKK